MTHTFLHTEFSWRRLAVWAGGMGVISSLLGCDSSRPAGPEHIPVASVLIAPVNEDLLVGSAVALHASPRAADGTELDREVTWWSDDHAIATVSSSGVVTAHARGTASIAAASEGKTSRVEVRVVDPNPVPVLTAMTPSAVAAGTVGPLLVQVVGTGFTDETRLRIDGMEQATDRIDDTTLRMSLSTTAMAKVVTWTVTATTPAPGGGTSNALALSIEAVSDPTITALEPHQITAGWGGSFTLTITGSGFTPQSSVSWDGAPRETRYVSPTVLQVTIDPPDVRAARAVPVTVDSPVPGGGSATATFMVNAVPVAKVTVQSPWGHGWTWRGHRLPLTAVAEDYLGRELADRPATWHILNPVVASLAPTGHRDVAVFGTIAGETEVDALVDGVLGRRTVRVHETPSFDVVYEAGAGDDRHLMLWDLSTGNAPSRLPTTVAAFSPAPSPDGQQIAFAGAEKGQGSAANVDLYIATRNGQVRRFRSSDAFDGDPAWSPDGTRLAFVSARWSGLPDVFVTSLPFGDVIRLTDAHPFGGAPGSGYATRTPAWSPDGTRLAYSVRTATGSQLWVMDADGANKRQLTNSADADDYEPVWSPDGSVIAFAREFREPRRSMVMTVRPDGSNATTIGGRIVNVAAMPSYSPDGQWLMTSEARGGEPGAVYAFSITANAGPRIVLPVTLGGGRHARWMRRP